MDARICLSPLVVPWSGETSEGDTEGRPGENGEEPLWDGLERVLFGGISRDTKRIAKAPSLLDSNAPLFIQAIPSSCWSISGTGMKG